MGIGVFTATNFSIKKMLTDLKTVLNRVGHGECLISRFVGGGNGWVQCIPFPIPMDRYIIVVDFGIDLLLLPTRVLFNDSSSHVERDRPFLEKRKCT